MAIVSIREMTEKLNELEPLLTRTEALNIGNVEALSDMIEETQHALATVNNITDNSFMAYVEKGVLIVAPIDPTVTAWATIGSPTDDQVYRAISTWFENNYKEAISNKAKGLLYALNLFASGKGVFTYSNKNGFTYTETM